MSPFEDVAAQIGDRLGPLSRRAQVLVFVCTADVLRPSFIAWLANEDEDAGRADILERALRAARLFSMTGTEPAGLADLIHDMERLAPETDGFTAAQDAWIAGDIALRVAGGTFEPRDGVWFALEPQFQATSERLFGVSDVGSELEESGERTALNDPALTAAVAGLERALEYLAGVPEPTDRDGRVVFEALEPLAV